MVTPRVLSSATSAHVLAEGLATAGDFAADLASNDAFLTSPKTVPRPTFESSCASAVYRGDVVALPGLWPLKHGGRLVRGRVAYEITGPAGALVVVVLGGISSGAHVTSTEKDPLPGWWQELVGPSKAIDTARFRVLSFDFLGGNGRSSGPRDEAWNSPGDEFPTIDTADQARVLFLLLEVLRIDRLHAIVGSSYGGMVALAFAERFPDRVDRLVVISAADRTHPRSTAWRVVQRRVVRLGLETGEERQGLCLARALAMIGYRTPEELERRFDGEPEKTPAAFKFPIENYLDARGEDFADRFHPRAFLCLSESIDLHRVDPFRIVVPTTLIAAQSDQLVPVEQLRSLHRCLAAESDLVEIESLYGHDAFLKEIDVLTPILRDRLDG